MLLLGLAGRLTDEAISRLRGVLAGAAAAAAGRAILATLIEQGTALADGEIEFLEDVLEASDWITEQLGRLGSGGHVDVPQYTFVPEVPPGKSAQTQIVDDTAVKAAVVLGTVRGIWRASRISPDSSQAKCIYTVEADEDANFATIAWSVQRALEAIGEAHPQVEVYPTGFELPPYHRFARAHGELLWARTPDPGVRIAVLFDEVDPVLGPRFGADHPIVDAVESRYSSDTSTGANLCC